MSHRRDNKYLVCVYLDSVSRNAQVVGVFTKRDKAERYLTEYLDNNNLNQGYVEHVSSFRNDKRNQWEEK